MRMTGHCKFFDSDRGFGFIQPDDNSPDIFVHCSQLLTGRNHLRALDRVQFEIGTSPRNGKPHAVNVRALGEAL